MAGTRPKVGLLLMYLELYDRLIPGMHDKFVPFIKNIENAFRIRGIDVEVSPICRVREEFSETVAKFETKEIDMLVTLHLAYSPSLESSEVLCDTGLPILILDTTMDYDFGHCVEPEKISFNHGIHGVQDMASLLKKNGKKYFIVAGHYDKSGVMDRAADIVRAAHAAKEFKKSKVLRIGESFKGMGDFNPGDDILHESLGIEVTEVKADYLADAVRSVAEDEVANELCADGEKYEVDCPGDVYERSVRLGLAIRKIINNGDYSAFSMNFLSFDSPDGIVNTTPFLECCKAMAQATGYAGEGDALTAALVGALALGFGNTTFTEIFCPDWKGDSLFFSHMGEINPDVCTGKPVICKQGGKFSEALPGAIIGGCVKKGYATLVNIVPGAGGSFRLVTALLNFLPDTDNPEFKHKVRGWAKPECGLGDFLEKYSLAGGTHHSALVLGDHVEAIKAFGIMSNLEVTIIK